MSIVQITALTPLGIDRIMKAYENLGFMQRRIFDTYFKWTTDVPNDCVIIEKRDKKNMNLLSPEMIAGNIKEFLLDDGLRENVDFTMIIVR